MHYTQREPGVTWMESQRRGEMNKSYLHNSNGSHYSGAAQNGRLLDVKLADVLSLSSESESSPP